MVVEKKEDYEIIREGRESVMKISAENKSYIPGFEDPACMSDAISYLIESPGVSRIIFVQNRIYQYSYDQVQMLVEIAGLYNYLIKKKSVLSLTVSGMPGRYLIGKREVIQHLVHLLKSDPIGAYVELRRVLREEKITLSKLLNGEDLRDCETFIGILKDSGACPHSI